MIDPVRLRKLAELDPHDKAAAVAMWRDADRRNADRRDLLAWRQRNNLLRFVLATFPGYDAGWVHEDICERLEQFSKDVAAKKSPRLMLFMPPRHGKSFLASERFPAWHLGRHPDHEIIVASYAKAQALKRSRAAQKVVRSGVMRETFPNFEIDPTRTAVEEWETTAGGLYKAVGLDGGSTGYGAHILIVDDPVKGWKFALSPTIRKRTQEWYRTDGATRLAPGGGVIVIQTRWHEDDLAGWLLREAEKGTGDQWEVVSYPAIAEEDEKYRKKGEALHPERWPLAEIKARIRVAGPYGGPALYQQRPTSLGGNLWKERWFKYFRHFPKPGDVIRYIQSWDCTFKDLESSDFVVGQVWAEVLGNDGLRHYYLVHQVRGRWDIVETIKQIEAVSELYPEAHDKLIEDKANGPAVISLLRGKIGGLLPIEPEGGKAVRMVAASGPIADGRVHLPDVSLWPDVIDYIDEVTKVPAAPHDDQADSTSQALVWLDGDGGNEDVLVY